MDKKMTERIKELIEKHYLLAVEIRHKIHQYPELAFEEFETSRLVAETLERHGIKVQSGIAKTGALALIEGKKPRDSRAKTVLLRADMDALPITEETDVPFASCKPGLMHACGHDGHTAGLVLAGIVLKELAAEFSGGIKLMFQPAEEGDGGAEPMIAAGILENPKVDAAFGCHLWGGVKAGQIAVNTGPLMASPDEFYITVRGRGGHAATPHITIDPIVIAAQIINSFQAIASRRNDPLLPLVISTCGVHGGGTHNIIPDTVELVGTVRTLNHEQRAGIPALMEQTASDIARSWGADCVFKLIRRYPPLINDAAAAALAGSASAKIVGRENVITCPPNMGGEDFAYLAEKVPSAFFFVGIAKDAPVIHHNSKFAWDDSILKISAAALCQTALDYLRQ
ncbi:MAG: amidohydrolase [Spirochaetaceae bacterium]|jgi:amidohydrolase|nr:amidohydrolase [Spirochaetaceae bacterium]